LKCIKDDTFDLQKHTKYAIVHHSNSIEGSTLTLEETNLLLEENLTPKNKPLTHSLMAIDHLDGLEYVIHLADNKIPLTVEIIQTLSSKILHSTGEVISAMAGEFDSSKGDFRKVTVRAETRTFIDYQKVLARVAELVTFINHELPLNADFLAVNELAFNSHFQMVSIHPFADGNGRISRLLMNYIQQFHQHPLTLIYEEDKLEYYEALEKTRANEDLNIFRKFMFAQAYKFFKKQIAQLSKPQSTKNIKGFNFLF